MRAILPLALLAAASASAQTPTFNLTASSANGGADTLFTWSYTGTLTFTSLKADPTRYATYFRFNGIDPTNPERKAYSSFGLTGSGATVFADGLNTGLVMTNTANGDFESPVLLSTFNPNGFIFFWNPYLSEADEVVLAQGQSVVLSGPTSGSFLSDIDFSGFNLGQWITPAFTVAGSYTVNYDQVFTVAAAPVPEPSTYGLALGGLALVGAVIRRRRSK